MHPRAREEDLVEKELADELLVYDLRTHRAHCLNHAARLVWRAADGRSTPRQIAVRLSEQLGAAVDEAVVWEALGALERAKLLAAPLERGPSRRAFVRGLAFALPAVLTVVAPGSARAARQSCRGSGKKCTQGRGVPCCPGLTCVCVTRGRRVKCTCQ